MMRGFKLTGAVQNVTTGQLYPVYTVSLTFHYIHIGHVLGDNNIACCGFHHLSF